MSQPSQPSDPPDLPLIKVVGISAGGKSTLVKELRKRGYRVQPVSQEHSNVPTLWEQFDRPRLLLYLELDLEGQRTRRPDVEWNKAWLAEERDRLRHARDHADLVIDTSTQSADAVLQIALTFLQAKQIRHADAPLPPLATTGGTLAPKPPEPAPAAPGEPTAEPKQRSNRTQRRIQKRAEKRKTT